ncbi:MAG TPA: hypothetical protein VGU65_12880 [Frateuria sp.]|uniref:hypothetical protein n=1 Tax=Frateuria sp. TaxID=2211372 RepID=UPI002DE86343|nr:hypothetical protein [Frateuria sp.]
MPTEPTEELRRDPERYGTFQKDEYARWKALDYITKPDWAKRSFMDDWIAYMSTDACWPGMGD